jgi:hypothetical protein
MMVKNERKQGFGNLKIKGVRTDVKTPLHPHHIPSNYTYFSASEIKRKR